MSTYDDASLIYYPSGYKAGTAYSLKPTDGSGDLTFTRASTATRVNSSGLIESVATGVPRIDYTGGGCGKLLLEPQRANLALYSEQFDNAAWFKENVTITPNAIASPSGLIDADMLVENSSNAFHAFRNTSAISATVAVHTFSIFLKTAGRRYANLSYNTTISSYVNGFIVDLQDGVITQTVGTFSVAPSVQNYGNGWFRVSYGAALDGGSFVYVNGAASSNSLTTAGRAIYIGSGSSSFYVWGEDLQLGSYPTSYIPTTTTAVTRVADVSATATSLFTNEGSIVVDLTEIGSQNTYVARVLQVYIDVNNVIQLTRLGTTYFFQVYNAGVLEVNISISSITTLHNKIGIAWKTNDCKIYINGVDKGTDTSCSLTFTPTYFGIATYFGGGTNYYANIHSVIAFPTRLSNAELATLTTI